MVFENLTLFELHFEDAQFGPRTMGESEESAEIEMAAEETEPSGGRRRYLPLVVVAVVVAAVAVRRYRGRGDEADIEIETTDAEEAEVVEN